MARGFRGGAAKGGGRLDTALLVVCVAAAMGCVIMPQRYREGTASALRNSVLAPLVALESRATVVHAAITARESELNVRGRVASEALSVRGLADENATLRRLIGLSARLGDGFVVAEVLPRRGVDDDFTLALNVGAEAGVQPFAPVVTADGLVGMIERVDRNVAFAITWAHPDFRVSAMSVDERAFGIVQPHLGSGVERLMLELRGVPFRAKLDSGAIVVSSGLGATYPRGIPVGVVIGEIATPERWARTYLLMPAVLPASIGPVLVLRSDRATRGVSQVWTNVASADSAARAIAAAGDSMARKVAFDELAARRAALDSAMADSLAVDTLASVARDTMRLAPPAVGRGVTSPVGPPAGIPARTPIARAPTSRPESLRADSARRARADSARVRVPPVSPARPRSGPPPADEER